MKTAPDGDDIIVCGGSAKPEDVHLASTIHCIDDEIISFLRRREKQRRKMKGHCHDQGS
jgi:hypothetical protein